LLEGETKDSDAVAGAAIARIVVMTGDSKRSLLLPRVGTKYALLLVAASYLAMSARRVWRAP